MNHRGVLDEMHNQNFERCSRLDSFMEALIGKIVNSSGFIATVAAFVKKYTTNAIEKEFLAEPKVTEEIPSPPDRSSTASVGSNLNNLEAKINNRLGQWQ